MASLARAATALLAIFLTGACSGAVTRLPGATPPAPARHVLPNGVAIVVEPHGTSGVVALQLWVRAGGRDEAPAELGLAHYLEHMLFKGTPARPQGFVEREIESVGGRINAGTSVDYTFYHVLIPAERATAAVEMLADLSVNATLEASTLDREKQVVLEEMRLGEDNPRRELLRRLYALVFEAHPYGRPVIGRPDLVRGLTRDALNGFYRRHYVPEAFTLVVVGPVAPAAILETATRTFGRIPRGDVGRLPAAQPPPPHPARLDIERAATQAHLAMGWLAPRIDHADTPAVDLLAAILGQARSARLTRALRDRLGLVTSIGSRYSALEAAGIVAVTAQLSPANLDAVEAEIVREVRRIRDEGVGDAERRRAVTVAEARLAFARETVEGRAHAYGQAETIWRLEEEMAYLDRLRSVTTEQLRAAARRYLDPKRYARVALVPGKAR